MNSRDYYLEQFQCAIFDLDGTLLNSTGVWADIDIMFLKKRGLDIPADYMENIKTCTFSEAADYTIKRFGLCEKPDDIIKEWFDMAETAYRNTIDIKPYAKEYLMHLKSKGIKLSVATSSDRKLYEPCLKRNGIYDLFDCFTQTDEAARGKEFPDVYMLAADRCGVAYDNCVVYEDVLKAVRGAKKGGFFTVAVADKSSEQEEDNIKSIADVFIRDYKEVVLNGGL